MVKITSKNISLTKITSPQANNPFLRSRLFKRLDQLRDNSIVWLVGPPGAGKTTLASTYLSEHVIHSLWYQMDASDANISNFFHYFRLAIQQAVPQNRQKLPVLSPEYLPDLTTFIRRYSEIIGGEVKKPALIVLDNYESIPGESPLHEAIRDLASYLPPEICLLILSRTEPPPAFARFRLHGHLAVLDSSELNLTTEEVESLVALQVKKTGVLPDPERIERVYKETQGWFTGFSILLYDSCSSGNGYYDPSGTQQIIFDYFATELFKHYPAHIQRGLLCTALLPIMTVLDVQQLTEGHEITKVLAELQRRNCFVVQRGLTEPIYEFHGLFRSFLLNRATTSFPPEEWRALQQKAANLLAKSNQVDAAVNLYQTAKDWTGLETVILSEGAELISAGRHQILEQWLKCLPTYSFKQMPWLFYWYGMARLPFDPVEAREHFEQAYAGFNSEENAEGLYLTWAGIMDTYFYEWHDLRSADRWIAEFETLRTKHPEFPTRAVEMRTYWAMGTLLHRQPQNPFLPIWAERAESILNIDDLELSVLLGGYLIIYYLWRGEPAKAQILIKRVNPWTQFFEFPPLVSILWSCSIALFYSVRGDLENCLQIVENGLSLAEKTGLHCWDFLLSAQAARCSLVAGNLPAADKWMSAMSTTMHNHSHINGGFFEHLQSNAAAQRGNWINAVEHARKGLAMAFESGVPVLEGHCRIDLARALIGQGDNAEWSEHLHIVYAISQDMGSKVLQYHCLEIKAYAAFIFSDKETERTSLALAFSLSLEMDEPIWQMAGPRVTALIYERALSIGIETEHVRQLIRRQKLLPSDPATAPINWPWPVRIVTMGRFEILCDDMPLRSSRKAQHKPLELIKILCALGGQAIHQERVTDALWPDAEADAADQALGTTLHRLRKLLQNEQAVRLEDRQLSLDFRYIWVDALAFDSIEHHSDRANRATLELAISFYNGQFLAGESAAWALGFRDKLRNQFLKMSDRLGVLLEQESDWLAAIKCYQNVIEIDPVAEIFYRRLMHSLSKLGQQAEAISVYQHCRQTLLTHLGASPSRETQDLYQKLITS